MSIAQLHDLCFHGQAFVWLISFDAVILLRGLLFQPLLNLPLHQNTRKQILHVKFKKNFVCLMGDYLNITVFLFWVNMPWQGVLLSRYDLLVLGAVSVRHKSCQNWNSFSNIIILKWRIRHRRVKIACLSRQNCELLTLPIFLSAYDVESSSN